LESSQLSAKCSEISVPDLHGVSNSIQIPGMYIILIISFPKDVRNMLESGLTYVLLALGRLES